jgi:hypothetical protein
MTDTAERHHARQLKMAGTALLLLAALLFIASFFVAARTPTGYDLSSCKGATHCDALPDSSNRQRIFFLGMASTLIIFAGGVVLRSLGNRSN